MFDRLRSRIAPVLRRAVDGVAPRAAHQPIPPPHPYDAGTLARVMPGKRVTDAGAASAAVSRVDNWQNLTTGMGDPSRDKLTYGSFAPVRNLDYGEIESLYYGDDMCERIVDSLPDEAFRRGFTLEGPDSEAVLEAFETLRVVTKLRDGYAWARLWGGAALVLGLDDGQTQEKPLNVEAVRGLKFINVVDRRYINPISYYENALSPDFGKPEIYQVTPAFGRPGNSALSNILIHETRLIKFVGTRIDDITTRRLAGWSYSVLQRPYDILRLFASSFQAAGQLMNDAGQAVFSVKGLLTQLSGPNSAAILQRFANLDQQRWAGRMILVDKDNEDFHREPVAVAGVDKMLEHFEMRLAAAARMPVTRLMGRAPAGMDATGDSDTQQWHESVKASQSNDLEPAIVRLADIVTAGAWSSDSENKVVWAAMEDPNDKEEAQVKLIEAQTWQIYTTIGSLSGEQVALVQFANQPMVDVIDEDALKAIVEAEYELAKDPPPPPPMIAGVPPGATPGVPNGTNRGAQPPPGPGKKLRPPPAAEHKYITALKGVMRGLHHETMAWLQPRIGRLAQKQDQQTETKTQLLSELAAHVDGLVNALAPKVAAPFAHLAGAIDANNRKAMGKLGLDVRGQLGPHIQQFQEWNQSLIKKAGRDYVDQIADVLNDPDTWGLRIEEIEALLVERGGVSESRAQLIARDQTSKLNASVNQFRQRNAGVASYEWSTSLDERVRDTHMANEGREVQWGNPPTETGDPGDDVNCRCVAIPIIPELADEEEQDIPMAAEE